MTQHDLQQGAYQSLMGNMLGGMCQQAVNKYLAVMMGMWRFNTSEQPKDVVRTS